MRLAGELLQVWEEKGLVIDLSYSLVAGLKLIALISYIQ